jgi:CCR4-NOT transcription complex subunit 2
MFLTPLLLLMTLCRALYPKFMSPWSDAKQVATHAVEPEFTLPACYHVQPQPVQTKLPQFHEETLFFIFYSQPRDLMQELAALELYVSTRSILLNITPLIRLVTYLTLFLCVCRYKKNWRYHKELQLWLTKESGTGPMEKTPHYERGFYVFFDPMIWKRVTKEFVLQYDQLEVRFPSWLLNRERCIRVMKLTHKSNNQ